MPSLIPLFNASAVGDLGRIEGVDFVEHIFHIAPEVSPDENQVWVLAVDTVILSLTLLGSFFILGRLSWSEYTRHAATTRIRLVESLIFTDVLMGVTGLIGCGLMLDHKPLVIDTPLCDGLGVVMVAVIFSQHLWTLSLAVATFMILVHPLHPITSWIEKYWYWLWPVNWGIAFGVSVLGYILYGYGPAGGICYYQNDAGLFAELIQFLPRAIVFLCIALLYGKLYVFLRRPDKIRTGYSDGSTSSLSKIKGSWFNSRGSRVRRPGSRAGGGGWFGRGGNKTIIVDDTSGGSSAMASSGQSNVANPPDKPAEPVTPPGPAETPKLESQLKHLRSPKSSSKRNTLPAQDLPPWEHVELPVFQVDGERYGGAEYHGHDRGIWREWHGFAHRKRASGAPSTNSGIPTPMTSPTKGLFDNPIRSPNTLFEDKVSPTTAYFDGTKLPESPTNSMSACTLPTLSHLPKVPERKHLARSIGSDGTVASLTTTAVDSSAPHSPKTLKDPSREAVQSLPSRQRQSEENSESLSTETRETDAPAPKSPTSPTFNNSPTPNGSVGAFPTYEGFDYTRRGSIPDGTLPFRRASGFAVPGGFPLPASMANSAVPVARLGTPPGTVPSIPGNIADLPGTWTPQSTTGSVVQFQKDLEKGEGESDGDDDDDEGAWDLLRMLKESPPEAANERQTTTSDNVEFVQESMAAYLNRKTSLLMLWFPLGYVMLFSVSTIRLVYDFVGNPPIELRALSRWMMFGQGLLDAFIYGLVEWHTKRVVRKRVRKGTFSPQTSHGRGRTSGSRHRSIAGGGTGTGTGTNRLPGRGDFGFGADSQTASGVRKPTSPTVSFVDPERSILQRLGDPPSESGAESESGSGSGSSGSGSGAESRK